MSKAISLSFTTTLFFSLFASHASAQSPLALVADGSARCVIVHGADDAWAAQRLQRWFQGTAGAEVPVMEASESPPEAECIILVGSAASNPRAADIARAAGLDLDTAALTPQGYVTWAGTLDGRDYVLLSGGGVDGTRYAVTDLFNWRLEVRDNGVYLAPCNVREVPYFPYRWFWNWDHRMDWGGGGEVGVTMGVSGVVHSYLKGADGYLIDFKNCIDYMADHKFNSLIIWGFLRDSHGGVEAAQEVCRYASERGIRILPGVGTSGYAGYYFEGDNPFNAATWLREHPELCAINDKGEPCFPVPCPSKKENLDWLDRGAEWLFGTFDVGGVNLEMGDFLVCYCDDCKSARARIDSDEPDYYKDMAISHSVTLKTMRALDPDAWLSYATYTGFKPEMAAAPPKFAEIIPDYALCQWTLTGMAGKMPEGVRPPTRHNVGYLHWCNRSTRTERDFYLERVRDVCADAAAAGFEGLDTYGELPAEWPNAELFYLAWEAFLWNPDMTVEEFTRDRLARLYGGHEAAQAFVDLIPLVRTVADRSQSGNLQRARESAVAAAAKAEPRGAVRWQRMLAYLDDRLEEARIAAEEMARKEAEALRGRKVAIASVSASEDDPDKGWTASKAVDGDVREPEGYWLTKYSHPESAWLELQFTEPSQVNRVALFHQLDDGHYRSRDYRILLRVDGQWREVVSITGNTAAGWTTHDFDPVATAAARLEITRSAHGNRMGVGEIAFSFVE